MHVAEGEAHLSIGMVYVHVGGPAGLDNRSIGGYNKCGWHLERGRGLKCTRKRQSQGRAEVLSAAYICSPLAHDTTIISPSPKQFNT